MNRQYTHMKQTVTRPLIGFYHVRFIATKNIYTFCMNIYKYLTHKIKITSSILHVFMREQIHVKNNFNNS